MLPRSHRILLLIAALAVSPAGLTAAARGSHEVIEGPLTLTVATPPPVGAWRRTSQGWRRPSDWPSSVYPTVEPPIARVHPVVLAALIGLVSLGALIGFGTPRSIRR